MSSIHSRGLLAKLAADFDRSIIIAIARERAKPGYRAFELTEGSVGLADIVRTWW